VSVEVALSLIGSVVMNELWTIVKRTSGDPVVPLDCNPSSDDQGMLVYRSRVAAESAAEYQSDMYDVDCEARRLDKVS
jgi:hypothetical protein